MRHETGKMSHETRDPKEVSRGMFLRAVVAAVVIAVGAGAVYSVEKSLGLTFDKPPMPLQQPLALLNKNIGGIPARYVAEGEDRTMTEEILEVLGTREYLLRRYVDLRQPAESPTSALHVNLNYYATGSSTPHVPEICWAGSGMIEAPGSSRRIFEIPDVKRRDGSVVTLRMNMISFLAPGSENREKLKNVAYMFEVNGEYVATPKEVTSRFWKASNKYAYDTKIEVTVGDGKQFCTQDEAQAAISEFIRAALPDIEACLPDPRMNAPSQAGADGSGQNK
jgi:hypothetical protein